MPDRPHPDLELFYQSLEGDDDDNDLLNEFDTDDGDYEEYYDPEDLDEEDDEDYDEEEMEIDEEEDDEDEEVEGHEDGPIIQITDGADGSAWLNLAALLNSTGQTTQAGSTLLSQLFSGNGPRTRAGGRNLTSEDMENMAAERRRQNRKWWTPQTEPHPSGLELLRGGEFGRIGDWRRPGRRQPLRTQSRARTWTPQRAQATVPNTNGTIVASYPSVPYVGQYAREDYSLFYAATQYFTLHLYDTSKSRISPRKPRPTAYSTTPANVLRAEDDVDELGNDFPYGGRRRGIAGEDTSMKKIKNVQGVEGSWTVTDCDADKKGEKMIYSSITPYVHMLYTAEDDSEHIELDFTGSRRQREDVWGYNSFGIWSIRFSADGKEVVAGCGGGKIMVYDIEAQRRSLSVSGHADDVNAVCFADESSTNILVSGSDDGYVKIWDRRSLSSSTPSGILVGATEGITYTSPKGDGRYIVVNSKDQAARLYDLRKMRSHSEFEIDHDAVSKYGQPHFDYRNSRYPPPRRLAHPSDCSVMTFRGHSVLRTLIRCHFSPRESTGQSYIYSGSADGMIHIWSLDGQVVQVLNRAESTPLRAANGEYSDPSAPERPPRNRKFGAMPYEMGQSYTVRDVSWHGYEPTLMSTCWEVDGGYRRGGTVAKHEWKGLGKGGLRRLEDWVEKECAEAEEA